MTQDQWPAELTARVAEQVRRYRKQRGMTAQDIAEASAALGLPVPRTVIANLETGRRASIDLPELLVLAKVLGIPPISLLFPLDHTPAVAVLPGQQATPWDAVAWFTGETRLEAPAPAGSPREVLDTYRAHTDAVTTALVSTRLARERRRKATVTLDPARRDQLLRTADQYEQLAFDDCRELRDARTTMHQRGLTPPTLPADLAFVDQPEPEDGDEQAQHTDRPPRPRRMSRNQSTTSKESE